MRKVGNLRLEELDGYAGHIQQLVKELESVESAYTTRQAEIERERTEWAEAKSSRATDLVNLDKEINAKKNAHSEAEAIYDQEKALRARELNDITEKIIQGKKSLESLNSKYETMMADRQTKLNNATQELETVRQTVTNEKATSLSAKEERENTLKELDKKLAEARSNTTQERGALNEPMEGLRQEYAQLQTKSDGESKALQSLRKNFSELQSYLAGLQVNLDTLRPEVEQNLSNLMVAQRSRDESSRARLRQTSAELMQVRTNNNNLISELHGLRK